MPRIRRYAKEFERRHSDRSADTVEQMAVIFAGMDGRQLRYRELTGRDGLDSGERGLD